MLKVLNALFLLILMFSFSTENLIKFKQTQIIQPQKTEKTQNNNQQKNNSTSTMREDKYPPLGIKCDSRHKCYQFYKCINNKCILQRDELKKGIVSLDVKREKEHEVERLAKRKERWAMIFNNEKEEEDEVPDELKSEQEMVIAIEKREIIKKIMQQQNEKKEIENNKELIKKEITDKLSNGLNLFYNDTKILVNLLYDMVINHTATRDEAYEIIQEENRIHEIDINPLLDKFLKEINDFNNKIAEMKKIPENETKPYVFEHIYNFVNKNITIGIYYQMIHNNITDDFYKKMSRMFNVPQKEVKDIVDIISNELNEENKIYNYVDKKIFKNVYDEINNGNISNIYNKTISEKYNISEIDAQGLIDFFKQNLNIYNNNNSSKINDFLEQKNIKQIYDFVLNNKNNGDLYKAISEKFNISESDIKILIESINQTHKQNQNQFKNLKGIKKQGVN